MNTQESPAMALNIGKAIKRIIDSVFTGGCDRLLSLKMQPDLSITGKFLDRRQIYDYTITPENRLRYVESNYRSDSYLEGLGFARADFVKTTKRRQCNAGKPCGGSCVARGYKCERELGRRESRLLDRVRAARGFAGGVPTSAIAGTVGVLAGAAATGYLLKKQAEAAQAEQLLGGNTPLRNQYYDETFPGDEEFDGAKLERLTPEVSSTAKGKGEGSHPIYKTTIAGKQYFLKSQSEAAISKEVAAYEIAKEVGLGDDVLPARRVYHKGKAYVANPLLDKDDIQSLGSEKGLGDLVRSMPKERAAEMLLFDYAIHNHDRHSGNLLARKNGDVLLIDHGAVKWDLPGRVSSKLDTKKNFFYKKAFNSDPDAEIPEDVLRRFVEKRDRVREITAYRYAGQNRRLVNPILDKMEKRFDIMESMLESGDRRIKHLESGKVTTRVRTSEEFTKKPQNGRVVNGIPLQTSDPNHYQTTSDSPNFKEPGWFSHLKGANRKSGAIVLEPDGRMWMYEPKNHYAGTKNTFAKGGLEPDLTSQQNAIKEAREELGLQIKIIDHLGDFSHATGQSARKSDKAVIRHYVAVRTGGAPWDAHWEADKVKLLTPDDARKLANKQRDQRILDVVNKYATSDDGIRKIQQAYSQESRLKAQKIWSPSMTEREAREWTASSAYKDPVYHATSKQGAEAIPREGFRLSLRKVGRAYGNGVYVGLKASDVETYRKLYSGGETLELRTNVRKVLDVDREMKKVRDRGDLAKMVRPRPQDSMRAISRNLGQQDSFDKMVRHIRRQNSRLSRELRSGKVSQDEYNQRYADFPESEAFSYIAQRTGYDAIKLTGGRARIGMMVVFDPKNVTVVKK